MPSTAPKPSAPSASDLALEPASGRDSCAERATACTLAKVSPTDASLPGVATLTAAIVAPSPKLGELLARGTDERKLEGVGTPVGNGPDAPAALLGKLMNSTPTAF